MPARPRNLQLALTLLALPILLAVPIALAATGAPANEFRGRYVLRHSDNFSQSKAVFTPALELANGAVMDLEFGLGAKPKVNPGSSVKLRGEARGNRILVAAGSTEVTGGSTASADAAVATKRVAVVLFTFSNATTQPYTPTYAAGIAFNNSDSVAAYYAASTWGNVTMTGDVFGWYQIASDDTSCSYSTWANQANQAAAAAGVDLSAYDHVTYGFPSVSSCGWSGLAYLPGRYSWLNGSGGMKLRTMAHELGHNFGTHHASTMNCTEGGVRVPLSATSSNCTSNEYGDPFTVMGASSSRKPTSFALGNFGWLPSARTATVTAAGDYTLAPLYSAGGVQSIQIQRASGSYLTLELREPASVFDTFATSDPAVNGVSIRITGAYSNRTQSQLVDTTSSTTGFSDAALTAGKTFVDPLSEISVTTVSASSSGAVVRIAWGATPPPTSDTQAPTQPGNLKATALDSTRVSLTWSASTDNVGVIGYRILRNSTLVTTVSGTSYTDTGLAPAATYGYQVVAVDAAGNASTPASASATTEAGDTQAPTVPGNLRATPGKGKKLDLAWDASTDNVGVAGYRVYRDDKLVATTTKAGYTDTLGGKTPTATYYVVAYDAAGNVSAPSIPLAVP